MGGGDRLDWFETAQEILSAADVFFEREIGSESSKLVSHPRSARLRPLQKKASVIAISEATVIKEKTTGKAA